MKNLTVIVFCITAIIACKQKTIIDFDATYKPNTVYITKIQNTTKTEIITKNSKDEKDKNSVEDHSVSETSSNQRVSLITKSLKPDQSFSWAMKIDSITRTKSTNDTKSNIENLIKEIFIEGFFDKKKEFHIDTIICNAINDNNRAELQMLSAKILEQNTFPSAKMKIGSEISKIYPIEFPFKISGPIRAQMSMKYRLKSIRNNFASFEIFQNMDSLIIAGKDVEIKGQGTGYCEYDIQNKYISKYHTITKTDMTLKMYGQIIRVKLNSIYDQETRLKN